MVPKARPEQPAHENKGSVTRQWQVRAVIDWSCAPPPPPSSLAHANPRSCSGERNGDEGAAVVLRQLSRQARPRIIIPTLRPRPDPGTLGRERGIPGAAL